LRRWCQRTDSVILTVSEHYEAAAYGRSARNQEGFLMTSGRGFRVGRGSFSRREDKEVSAIQ